MRELITALGTRVKLFLIDYAMRAYERHITIAGRRGIRY